MPESIQPSNPSYMGTGLPRLDLPVPAALSVPDEGECRALWQHFGMFEHIGQHSYQVALFAKALAEQATLLGMRNVAHTAFAAGMLHDIAKSYTVQHGGSHAQLGASWVMAATGHQVLAQAVLHHVWWPWDFPQDLCHPVFFVLYADKRVMHDTLVDIDARYEDLRKRYGKTEASRNAIEAGYTHAHTLEKALGACLELSLNAYTLTGGRLVKRA